jgi:hypothetical protein
MKLAKIGFAVAALALVLCSRPELSWASRIFTAVVTGHITAVPYGGKIEVDHHSYAIKAGSPADQASHNVSVGDVVDLVLDAAATEKTATVIAINKHSGSK